MKKRMPRLNLKSSFWLMVILGVTVTEVIFLGHDMSFNSALVLSLIAILSLIAFDVSRILQLMMKERDDD